MNYVLVKFAKLDMCDLGLLKIENDVYTPLYITYKKNKKEWVKVIKYTPNIITFSELLKTNRGCLIEEYKNLEELIKKFL